jgi:hypothetical protein
MRCRTAAQRGTHDKLRNSARRAAKGQTVRVRGLGTEIASLFAKIGLDEEIPEFRGYGIEPPSFGISKRPATGGTV